MADRGAADLDRLERRITHGPPFRGRPALLRACADLHGELTHSDTEAEAKKIVRPVLAAFGLRLERRPYPVQLDGRIVGEADLAVVSILLDLEVDGPHHLLWTP